MLPMAAAAFCSYNHGVLDDLFRSLESISLYPRGCVANEGLNRETESKHRLFAAEYTKYFDDAYSVLQNITYTDTTKSRQWW